jgi:hypothetical protein
VIEKDPDPRIQTSPDKWIRIQDPLTDPQHCLVEDRHVDGVLGVEDGKQEDVVGPLVGVAARQFLLHLHIRRHIRIEDSRFEANKTGFIFAFFRIEANQRILLHAKRIKTEANILKQK